MEKNSRLALLVPLLGTLFLHAAIGILWAQSVYVPRLPTSPQKDSKVVVQLRSEQNGLPANSQLAISEQVSLPNPPNSIIDGSQSSDTAEATYPPSLPSNAFVLPPQELPYLAATELDARAYPEAPVVIPFPEGALNKSKSSAILILFISADGKVDRIEIDKSDLPPLFEKTAIETFLQAKMHPGLKNGKVSRAQMKILVEFEAR